MRKLLLSFFSCFIFYGCWAQQEDNVWVFGDSLALDFNTPSPSLISSEITASHKGSASVSDANGQLLFYTNGGNVWDRNNNVMPNGNIDQFLPPSYVAIRQNAVIVPVPSTPEKYYVFTLTGVFDNNTGWIMGGGLYYSVIDMSLNGGLGDVIAGQSSVLIDSGYCGGLAAVAGDRCNIWLVSRKLSEYHAYEITDTGINKTPAVSSFSNLPQQNSVMVEACFKFSPDGTKMIANTGEGWTGNLSVKLYNFNKATGILSSQKLLLTDADMQKEFAFSPDGSKLYVAITPTICNGGCDALIQLDLSLPSLNAIIASRTILTPIWGGITWFCIKAARNGKLYAIGPELNANYNPNMEPTHRAIYEINQPNLAGIACAFNPNPIFPSIIKRLNVFPNETFSLQYDTITRVALDTAICTQNNSFPSVDLKAPVGYYKYSWDNGSKDTFRQISTPGTYWVKHNEDCNAITDTFIVRQSDISFSLGNDTTLCSSDAINLKVDLPNATMLWQDFSTNTSLTASRNGNYWVTVTQGTCTASDTIAIVIKNIAQNLGSDTSICSGIPINIPLAAKTTQASTLTWSTGSTANSIVATEAGTFWVTVTDSPCILSDTVHIESPYCGCNFTTPNAFTPNRDGRNDVFSPIIEAGCPIGNYVLNIYNRFGQRVFTSIRNTQGWDGSFHGAPCDVGVYFYELQFIGGDKQTTYHRTGDIALIR